MVDRDPVTEPAGDMLAANTLIEVITWMDDGDERRLQSLCDKLLGWKGGRLRAGIADTWVIHLGRRQEQITPQSPPDELSRLARASALVFFGPSIEHLIQEWLTLSMHQPEFRKRILQALGEMIPLLTRRHEDDICAASVALLQARAALPPDTATPTFAHRTRQDLDADLAEHIYRNFSRSRPELATSVQQWFLKHPGFQSPQKHRVLQSAALLGHWDVIDALFSSGHPYGAQPASTARGISRARRGAMISQSIRRTTRRAQLSDYILDRMDQESPHALMSLASIVAHQLHQQDADPISMLTLLDALVRRGQQDGSSPAVQNAIGCFTASAPQIARLAQHPQEEIQNLARKLYPRLSS